jgi:hypothetical protein
VFVRKRLVEIPRSRDVIFLPTQSSAAESKIGISKSSTGSFPGIGVRALQERHVA